jgi:hypothetical protein
MWFKQFNKYIISKFQLKLDETKPKNVVQKLDSKNSSKN